MTEAEPLVHAPTETLGRLLGICFDLDDTFSTGGRIEPDAFEALWKGHRAGLAMVVVTGRSAGWCDHLCRMWPVTGVVGENGAFYFAYDADRREVIRKYAQSADQRAEGRRRLEAVLSDALVEVPGVAAAADQPYRESDLAIDFAEDVGPLDDEVVARIVDIFKRHGAEAKASSIHVNGWFGRYDKRGMLLRLASERLALSAEEAGARLAYVGDSPNDVPMFGYFDVSIGVANIARFWGEIEQSPAYVARRSYGAGFAEVVELVVRARRGREGISNV